jgi:excisionase family DNA binding protein
VTTCLPRLLDVDAAASYLGVSSWTIRDLDAAGVLPRVRVPLPNGGELRRLLFDRADLDRLIDVWKDLPLSTGGR